MVQINLDIPGYLKERDLHFLGAFVRDLPESAVIYDIGCGWGREAWVFSKNAPSSSKITCFDVWGWTPSWNYVMRGDRFLNESERTFQNSEEEFKRFTSDCQNITPVKADKKQDWSGPPADFIFFDEEDEIEEIIMPKLRHWIDHLKPGGVICGADYYPFSRPQTKLGVLNSVRNVALERNKIVLHPAHTCLWMMIDLETLVSWRSKDNGGTAKENPQERAVHDL